MIRFTTDDIDTFSFEVTHEWEDDGDPIYNGYAVINFRDGTQESFEIKRIRSGDMLDIQEGNVDILVQVLEQQDAYK